MKQIINISSNGIKQAIDDLVNENELLQDKIYEQEEENKRLNNIINELEKYLIEEIEDYDKHINSQYITDIAREQYEGEKVCFEDTLGKLQELKGSNEPSFEEMVGFVENVCKDIKSQPTLNEELEKERKTIAKIVGDFKEVNK